MIATARYVPGKRIRTWHRSRGKAQPLRAFARELAATGNDNEKRTAADWLRGKGVRL